MEGAVWTANAHHALEHRRPPWLLLTRCRSQVTGEQCETNARRRTAPAATSQPEYEGAPRGYDSRMGNSPVQSTVHPAWPAHCAAMEKREQPGEPRHPHVELDKTRARTPHGHAYERPTLAVSVTVSHAGFEIAAASLAGRLCRRRASVECGACHWPCLGSGWERGR